VYVELISIPSFFSYTFMIF